MNVRLWFTLLVVLVLCSGCESMRDAMLSDGGRFLTDTLANSLGLMMDEKLAGATDGMLTGADAAELMKQATTTALHEAEVGSGWLKGTLTTLTTLGLGGLGIAARKKWKAEVPTP